MSVLASDGTVADIQAIHDDAGTLNGDTITIPDGSHTWTTALVLTKAIKLEGLGTVTFDNHEKPRATACGTKIVCNVETNAVITFNLVSGHTSTLCAIEFIDGTRPSRATTISVVGTNDSRRFHMYHCASSIDAGYFLNINTALGCIHHNTFATGRGGHFNIDGNYWNDTPGTDNYGSKSWAEAENYGTDGFMFFEDNTFVGQYCRSSSSVSIGTGTKTFTVPAGIPAISGFIRIMFWDAATGKPNPDYSMYGAVTSHSGTTLEVLVDFAPSNVGSSKDLWILCGGVAGCDGQYGCREVVRSNLCVNWRWEWHGTEANTTRGGRCMEFYSNEVIGVRNSSNAFLFRSGTGLVHSNSFSNFQESNVSLSMVAYTFRQDQAKPWGGADGRNAFHTNAATAVETGTVTSAGTRTLTDGGKSWNVNEWQNYTLRPTSGISVVSMTRSGSTVTIVTATPHGLTTGVDAVTVMGADQFWYNGLYEKSVVTVVNGTTFTAVLDGVQPASPATGTIKMRKGGPYAHIKSNNATQLTFTTNLYDDDARDVIMQPGDTYEINRVGTLFDQPGMGHGSIVLGVVQTPPVGWPDQAVSPIRQWGNTGSSIAFDQLLDFSGANYATIVSGAHYRSEALPGHTDYAYPHPLQSEVTGGGTTVVPRYTTKQKRGIGASRRR